MIGIILKGKLWYFRHQIKNEIIFGRTISAKYVPQIWYISANSIIQIQRNNLILENCQLLILRIQKSYFLNSLFTKSIRKECANFVDKLDLSSWSNKKRPLQRPMLFVQKAYCRPLIYFYLYLFDTRKKMPWGRENVTEVNFFHFSIPSPQHA